jgi:ribosomal protein S4
MIFKKKSRFKPLYKKFIKLRENVQNRQKVLKFRKQKWSKFIVFYKRKLKWYKKFRPQNQNQYLVSKYPNRYTSYTNRYKNTLQAYKTFSLLYGSMKKRVVKNKINIIKNRKVKDVNSKFLEMFERRLDVVLYRAKFCHSLRSAHQFIVHGKILVNNRPIKSKFYELKTGDLISIDLKYLKLVESNIWQSEMWPIPPKHLLINYKTMQIVFCGIENTNLFTIFPFHLKLEQILVNLSRQ